MVESSLPKLLFPQPEAEEKITAQIKQGREILGSLALAQAGAGLGLDKVFETTEEHQENWAKYTIDLLRSLFSSESIAHEFGSAWIQYPPRQVQVKAFVEWMNERIRRLQSIVQRLPLFPLAVKKSA